MLQLSDVGVIINYNELKAKFRIPLPSIDSAAGFKVFVYLIKKEDQFNPDINASKFELTQSTHVDTWGEYSYNMWNSEWIPLEEKDYIYRFEIVGPKKNNPSEMVSSPYFGDPFAFETSVGTFSQMSLIKTEFDWGADEQNFGVPNLADIILYEVNIDEFGLTFDGVVDKIDYLKSLGVNTLSLMPITSIAEENRWGYLPIFYFAPEERFGGGISLKNMVKQCHANGISVILDMVYAHADGHFPFEIGYNRFFHLSEDPTYFENGVLKKDPNPIKSSYSNFARKNDWRKKATVEFFQMVNLFWMDEYHIDGFRYDHVNGYLDKKPVLRNNKIDWYSQENRPLFISLEELSVHSYNHSKKHSRFTKLNESNFSNLIQIAEDLGNSPYQLGGNSKSAINGCWEKGLQYAAIDIIRNDKINEYFCRELLVCEKPQHNNSDPNKFSDRWKIQNYTGNKNIGTDKITAFPVQYLESHDDSRMMYILSHKQIFDPDGLDFHFGLENQSWWKLQPFAIALMTSVGIPMLFCGQEFGENYGLPHDGGSKVRGRRGLHWSYFYNHKPDKDGQTVLPLTTLYRHLGKIRVNSPTLKQPRENSKLEYIDYQ